MCMCVYVCVWSGQKHKNKSNSLVANTSFQNIRITLTFIGIVIKICIFLGRNLVKTMCLHFELVTTWLINYTSEFAGILSVWMQRVAMLQMNNRIYTKLHPCWWCQYTTLSMELAEWKKAEPNMPYTAPYCCSGSELCVCAQWKCPHRVMS